MLWLQGHIAVDRERGFILASHTTTANRPDCKQFMALVNNAKLKDDAPVLADKGYSSAANRSDLAKAGLFDPIMYKAISLALLGGTGFWQHEESLRLGAGQTPRAGKDEHAANALSRGLQSEEGRHPGRCSMMGLQKGLCSHSMGGKNEAASKINPLKNSPITNFRSNRPPSRIIEIAHRY